ncbi:unnamed protein product [Fraxinus pennsylvanica]|uniref:Uncharacterized protein n=1 Tax=Fraxinus pennsylvanica TaxID=56036 RepID=A0AAD1Z1W0_9LAMI|nr:unnamed protein product [Fraxinus pennsylvanica]
MAQGPEFCLPAEFLTDEDFVIENEKFNEETESVSEFCFPTEFPYDFGTYTLGSPEIESDDEDLLAALTCSSFYQHLNPTKPQNLEKDWMSGSPQSTLTQVGSTGGSYDGSHNGPSQVPSPPTTLFGIKNNKPWELIYHPAVQVPKHKLNGGGLSEPPRSLVQLQYPAQNLNAPVFHNTRFQQVRVDRSMNQPNMGCGMWYSQHQMDKNRGARLVGGMGQAAYQIRPTQKFSGSGTTGQVSFGGYGGGDRIGPGGAGGKKGCAGTGVFFPRRYGANNEKNAFPSDSRKKLVSSTALLPDGIIHALNKNIFDVQSRSQPGYFIPDYDTLMSRRNALLIQHQLGLSSSTRSSYHPQDWSF